ncbi:Hsp20/alpha crystallin family protein [Pinibacter soli]|uniref:Hsp20/alpha crystallin family protein n=1 Tax=Pinibacter soli TaxID=3044211 RepID=A0ABT6RFV0_9BACT|nr:Hsp20/alpha crystallin family protein [Pinibacter soli]MDI3321438.1 Hsp20/alpha crystallin family protein [Pinibacter soli]
MNSIIKKENGQVPAFGSVVDQIFQNNLSRFFDDTFWTNGGSRIQVPANIRETATSYELHVVAPGLKKEDFKLNLNKDLLTISYDHTDTAEQQEQEWIRREYKQQTFSRSFSLNEAVDSAKITASYKDGVLQVVLPKKENSKNVSQVIQVQ